MIGTARGCLEERAPLQEREEPGLGLACGFQKPAVRSLFMG
ncbi:MAG: hypothetical protein QHH75_07465 [Bacillota bacterium]|nr:hypothetical protein [Bacillota bacterium]